MKGEMTKTGAMFSFRLFAAEKKMAKAERGILLPFSIAK